MKKKYLAVVIAASLALSACVATSSDSATGKGASVQATDNSANKVFSQKYLFKELSNGLRVLVVKTDYPDLVSVQIPVSVGSRDEDEVGKTGFAHFFEHMMFKGSDKFPQDVYSDLFKNAGVDNGAYTTNDYTNYHLDFSKDHLDKVLEIQADHFKNLTYTDAQFKTEALTVKGEYLKTTLVRRESY